MPGAIKYIEGSSKNLEGINKLMAKMFERRTFLKDLKYSSMSKIT